MMIASFAVKFIMTILSTTSLVAVAKSSASRSSAISRSTRLAFCHFSTLARPNTENNHKCSSSSISRLIFKPSGLSSSALHMADKRRNNSGRSKPGGDNKKKIELSSTSTSTISGKSSSGNSNDKTNSQKQVINRSNENSKNNTQNKTSPTSKPKSNTGRLRLLPPLQPTNEILSRAQRQTYNEIKDDTSIANIRRRTQKRGAQTIDSLCQKLCLPLKNTVQNYRREFRIMHPFEKVVMELTIQSRQKKDGLTLYTLLDDIHEGRKELLQLSKDWISKIKSAESAREAYECTEEAKEVIGQVFLDLIEGPWSGVMELQKSLRNVPIVRLDCPAVVLVGAPNVGKSSIVRAISSGTPEVNNYPFTTRGMTLGHVQVFWESDQDVAIGNVAGVSIPSEKQLVQENLVRLGVKTRRMKEKELLKEFSRGGVDNDEEEEDGDQDGFGEFDDDDETTDLKIEKAIQTPISRKSFPISQLCQIMDSPGLLRRDDGDTRNEMEELTLAAMAHLPTAVMYVMDLSGGAGDRCSSVEDQLILRREVRARFPRRPWIDVISKADLGIIDGAEERLKDILKAEQLERARQRGLSGDDAGDEPYYIILSIKEGMGVDELRQEVMRMLGEVRVVLDAMAAVDERIARPV